MIVFTILNGISATCGVLVSIFLIVLNVKYYRNTKNSLYICGFLIFTVSFSANSAVTVSFIWLLLNNGVSSPIINSVIWIFMYTGNPVTNIAMLYVIWTLIGSPEKKKFILMFYGVMSAIYYISLYVSPQVSVSTNIPLQQWDLYDDWLNPLYITYYMYWAFSITTTGISAVGFNKLMKKSKGEVKRKAQFIQLAAATFGLGALGEFVILGSLVTPHEYYLWIGRFLMVIGMILIHLAFKPKKSSQ